MKNTFIKTISLGFLVCGFAFSTASAQTASVDNNPENNGSELFTICHIPPGNPDNCHQITISENALQTHLDHGDKIFCYEEPKLPHYLQKVDNDPGRIIIMFQKDHF